MPEIQVATEYFPNGISGWNGPTRVYHEDGLSGYWTYQYTLPGNVFDSAKYTHKWRFYAWKKTGNWNGSSYPGEEKQLPWVPMGSSGLVTG
jgi:hypothetical protein